MKIIPMLIPSMNKFTRPGIAMDPEYITVHETDNARAGATALAHARLQKGGNSRQASWHFTVDDKEIYQSIPTTEIAFHAGDSKGLGNYSSIAVEICVNADGDFGKAKANAVELIRHLMDKHHIPIERVVPHKKWSGKNCPRNILKSGWNIFIAQVKGGATVSYLPFDGVTLKDGSDGCNVKLVQLKLGGLVVDGKYGARTEAKVKDFQKAHKLAVDGVVGPITWGKLFA